MLLIEHWYPRKYSVTCTFTILPVMARRTMLLRQACSVPPCRHTWRWLPDSPTPPRRDNPTVWNSHCKQRCVIPPFAEPIIFSSPQSLVACRVPVCGAPIQPLPASARCQSAQIRDPGTRKKYLWPLGFRHVWGPLKHHCPIVADRKSTRLNSSHLGISY